MPVGPEADFQDSTMSSNIKGGGEGRVSDQWSGKLEHLYIVSPDTPLSAPATTGINRRWVGYLLRIGLDWRF